MAPKAVLGIRTVFATWLGESHEAAQEAAVAAEIMRIRTELNRYKAAAGDEPADDAIVYAELQTAILPVIANYAHIYWMTHGASPNPSVWARDWEAVFANLLSGTQCRARYAGHFGAS